jgi:hypothetical protein
MKSRRALAARSAILLLTTSMAELIRPIFGLRGLVGLGVVLGGTTALASRCSFSNSP